MYLRKLCRTMLFESAEKAAFLKLPLQCALKLISDAKRDFQTTAYHFDKSNNLMKSPPKSEDGNTDYKSTIGGRTYMAKVTLVGCIEMKPVYLPIEEGVFRFRMSTRGSHINPFGNSVAHQTFHALNCYKKSYFPMLESAKIGDVYRIDGVMKHVPVKRKIEDPDPNIPSKTYIANLSVVSVLLMKPLKVNEMELKPYKS